MRWLERGAIVLVSLAIAIGIIVLLSGGIAGTHDDPGIAHGSADAPGTAYRDQGHATLAPGAPHPAYDSDPPTSGPHAPASLTRDDARITTDQLLTVLAQGNVVFLYSGTTPPRGLRALADTIAGGAQAFTPALARDGQAVIIARWSGLRTITAVAWTRMLRSDDAGRLEAFARAWLGRGAGARATSVAGNE